MMSWGRKPIKVYTNTNSHHTFICFFGIYHWDKNITPLSLKSHMANTLSNGKTWPLFCRREKNSSTYVHHFLWKVIENFSPKLLSWVMARPFNYIVLSLLETQQAYKMVLSDCAAQDPALNKIKKYQTFTSLTLRPSCPGLTRLTTPASHKPHKLSANSAQESSSLLPFPCSNSIKQSRIQ